VANDFQMLLIETPSSLPDETSLVNLAASALTCSTSLFAMSSASNLAVVCNCYSSEPF
jgi:hypothetical protein